LARAAAAAQTLATARQRLRTLLRAISTISSSGSSSNASASCRVAAAVPRTDIMHTCAVLETCLSRCLGNGSKHIVDTHRSSSADISSQAITATHSARPYIVGSHSVQSSVSQLSSSDQTAAASAATVTDVPAWITALLAK
jgi:hypothetical protein